MARKLSILTLVTIFSLVALVMVGCASPAPAPSPSTSPAAKPPASSTPASPSPSAQPPAKKIVLSLATTVPDSDIKTVAARQFADEVGKKTNGAIEIQVFPNGQLIKDKDMVTALPAGMADFAQFQLGSAAGIVPEASLLELGMYYSSEKHQQSVADGKLGEIISQKLASKGNIKFLSWFAQGPTESWSCNSKTIKLPDDLKGLKFRTPPSPNYVKAVSALGAAGTIISAQEVYTALQTGTVQATFCTTRALVEFKWYEVAPYVSRMTFNYDSTQALNANLDSWNKLSAEHQNIILQAAKNQQAYTRANVVRENEEWWAKLAEQQKTGKVKEIYVVPEESKLKFLNIVAPALKEVILKDTNMPNPQQLLDIIEQARPK